MRWIPVLLGLLLLVPGVGAQGSEADLRVNLPQDAVEVVVGENRTLELRIHGTINCYSGMEGPGDLNGGLSRHGQVNDPIYWRIDPSEFQVPWELSGGGLWSIDTTVDLTVNATAHAPHEVAGEERLTVFINAKEESSPTCSPMGYSWEEESQDLSVIVPLGDEGATKREPETMTYLAAWQMLTLLGALLLALVLVARLGKKR